jgi:uncharacterized iron-regulated membrane protein
MIYLLVVLLLIAVLIKSKLINPVPGLIIVGCVSLISGINYVSGAVLLLTLLYIFTTRAIPSK